MKKKNGILYRLSCEIYYRRAVNKKVVKFKRSWDEVKRIICNKNTKC